MSARPRVRCRTCGGKNPWGADRCQFCTRPLAVASSRTQAIHEESLYQRPVSNRRDMPRAKVPAWLPILVVLVGLGAANYLWLGYGPSWAHRPQAATPGSTWREFRDPSGIDVRLPGRPVVDRVDGPTGTIDRARNEVDGNWVATITADQDSPAARMSARARRHATVTFATANSPGDMNAAPLLLSAIAPGAQLAAPTTTPVPGEDSVEVVAAYHDFPDRGDTGTARAVVTRRGPVTSIAAVFTQDGDDQALLGELVTGIGARKVP